MATSKSGKRRLTSARGQAGRRTGSSETRLSAEHHLGISYVTFKMIVAHHGQPWAYRWAKVTGVNTCVILPSGEAGIYYQDYERFADVVDHGKATYFD